MTAANRSKIESVLTAEEVPARGAKLFGRDVSAAEIMVQALESRGIESRIHREVLVGLWVLWGQ